MQVTIFNTRRKTDLILKIEHVIYVTFALDNVNYASSYRSKIYAPRRGVRVLKVVCDEFIDVHVLSLLLIDYGMLTVHARDLARDIISRVINSLRLFSKIIRLVTGRITAVSILYNARSDTSCCFILLQFRR